MQGDQAAPTPLDENETKADPGEQAPPRWGGSGSGEAPRMGCAASAQDRMVKQTTPRQNHPHAGSIPETPHDAARTQAREVEPTPPRDDMRCADLGSTEMDTRRPGPLRHEPSVLASKSQAEELKRRMDKRDEINRQIQCDKETDQESLNKKLETLFDVLRGTDPVLMKSKHGSLREEQKQALADELIALGISRRADDFINDLLDESIEQLNTSGLTAKVKEELQISLRFLPLHMSFLVRIYKSLSADPPLPHPFVPSQQNEVVTRADRNLARDRQRAAKS